MIAFLLTLALAAPPCLHHGPTRPDGKPWRDPHQVALFMKAHPCPGGPDKGSVRRCRGWTVDHRCPLECCGPDAPSNMQWQTAAQAKLKDRWEGNCSTCGGKAR